MSFCLLVCSVLFQILLFPGGVVAAASCSITSAEALRGAARLSPQAVISDTFHRSERDPRKRVDFSYSSFFE